MSEDSTKTVVVYGTTWCTFCKTEKQYLDKLGVKYAYKDIEKDKTAYDELMKKSGGSLNGVPVTDIAGTIISGFNRIEIDKALKANNLV